MASFKPTQPHGEHEQSIVQPTQPVQPMQLLQPIQLVINSLGGGHVDR